MVAKDPLWLLSKRLRLCHHCCGTNPRGRTSEGPKGNLTCRTACVKLPAGALRQPSESQTAFNTVQEIRIGHRREAIQEETDAKQEVKGLKRKYIPYTFENGDTRKELLARRRHLLFKSLKSGVNHRKSEPKILFKEYPVHQKSIMSGFRDASARIRPPC